MKLKLRGAVLFSALVVFCVVGSGGLPRAEASESQNAAGVVPPQARVDGATYGDWSARWWQWALGTPVHTGATTTHPLLTTGNVDCSIGQHGDVWFLGGNFVGKPGIVLSRSCHIPSGVFLFTPITNAWADNSNCDGFPPTTNTTAQLRAIAADSALIKSTTSLSVTLDGGSVDEISSTATPYRATSPVLSYTVPADNIIINAGLCTAFHPQTVTGAVADGVYGMLKPLSAGTHTLHWTVSDGGTLVMDVTYHLTV